MFKLVKEAEFSVFVHVNVDLHLSSCEAETFPGFLKGNIMKMCQINNAEMSLLFIDEVVLEPLVVVHLESSRCFCLFCPGCHI